MVNFQINTDSYNPGNLGEVELCSADYRKVANSPGQVLRDDDLERGGYNLSLARLEVATQEGFRDRFWEYLNDCVVDLGRQCYSKQPDGTIYTYKQQLQQVKLDDVRQQISDYFRDRYNKSRWRRALEYWWGDKSQANEIDKKRKLLLYQAAWQLLHDYYPIVQQEGKYDSDDLTKLRVINNFFDALNSDKDIDNELTNYVRQKQKSLTFWQKSSPVSSRPSSAATNQTRQAPQPRVAVSYQKPSLFQKMRTKLQNSYVAQKLGAIKNSDFVQNIGAKLKGWGSKMLGFFKKSNTSGRSTTSTSEQQQTSESEQNPQQIEQTARFRTPEDAKALLEEYKTNNNRMFRAPLQRLGITDLPAFPDREFDNVWAELEASNELQESTKRSVLSLLEKINDNNRDLDREFHLLSPPFSDAINQQGNHDNHSTRQDRADSTPNNPDDLSLNLGYADNVAPRRCPSLSGNPAALYGGGHNLAEYPDLINQNPERSQSPQPISH